MNNNSILITFDSIVDRDYGIVKIVKKYYGRARQFKGEILLSITTKNIFSFLVDREESNIVKVLLKPEYKHQANKLKREIEEAHFYDIIQTSCVTNVNTLINQYKKTGLIDITVICKNKTEEQFIKTHIPGVKTIMSSDWSVITIEDYGTIFIKDCDTLLLFKDKLNGKKVYLSNYKFNLEYDANKRIVVKRDVLTKIKGQVEICLVDVYNIPDKTRIKG